jgi:hypothetical protein
MREINLDKVKKTDEQIINKLLDDTREGKLSWYSDMTLNYMYCRRRIVKDPSSNIKEEDKIDIIFKLSDDIVEQEQDTFPYEFQDYFSDSYTIISLDIYMSKNLKREVFCRRVTNHQLKLTELMSEVIHVLKKNQLNKNGTSIIYSKI